MQYCIYTARCVTKQFTSYHVQNIALDIITCKQKWKLKQGTYRMSEACADDQKWKEHCNSDKKAQISKQ